MPLEGLSFVKTLATFGIFRDSFVKCLRQIMDLCAI